MEASLSYISLIVQPSSPNSLYKDFLSFVNSVLANTGMLSKNTFYKKNKKPPWFTNECLVATKAFSKATKSVLKSSNTFTSTILHEVKKSYHKISRQTKNASIVIWYDKLAKTSDSKFFWKLIGLFRPIRFKLPSNYKNYLVQILVKYV